MPRQPRRVYKKVLSALRKNELTQLCTDLGLPSAGAVPELRNRLKGHLRACSTTNFDPII